MEFGFWARTEELVGLNALNSQQLLEEVSDETDEVGEEVLRGSHEIGLTKVAVQRALDLAIRGQTEFEDGAEATGSADDVAVLGGCWGRSEKKRAIRITKMPSLRFIVLVPFGFSCF